MTPQPSDTRGARFGFSIVGLALGCCLTSPSAADVEVSGLRSGIAIAPFFDAGPSWAVQRSVPDVARLLARELASQSRLRVVAPDELRRDRRGAASPEARDVRRWALRYGVDRVIVGRTARGGGESLDVQVELRSGHSGAAEAEYRLEPEDEASLSGAVRSLATDEISRWEAAATWGRLRSSETKSRGAVPGGRIS